MSIPAIDTADFLIDIQSKFNNKGTEQAISAVKEVKSEIGSFVKSADLGESSVKRFLNSFGRIAKLRMMRAAIRAVGTSIKEGTQNLYYYSQALNNADASRFASTMDELASSMLYMKNSIGAVVAPLLTSLLPAIQSVVNWFVTATQVIAQFFAVLGGQSTYTIAKKQATSWKEVGASVGGAAAAAKEYQNTILSFDEIHALNDTPSGGGGGGGGGASVPDYSDMFEEAEIADTWLNRLAKTIKDNFEDILDITKAIATVLIGWKIAQKVSDFFGKWFGGGKNAATAMLGITMMLTGFSLEWKGAYDIGYNGMDLGNMIKTMIGSSLGIAGSAITFGALGLGTGAGLVIGVAASLLILFEGIRIGATERYLDDTIRATDSYKHLTEIISNANAQSGTFISNIRDLTSRVNALDTATGLYAVSADVAYGKALIERIKELAGKTNLTAAETAELEVKCQALNDLGLEGIQVQFDHLTSKVTANWQEIDKNIEKLIELARTSAAFDMLTEAYQKQFDLEQAHTQLLEDNAYATQEAAISQEMWEKALEESGGFLSAYDRDVQALADQHNHATEAVNATSAELRENEKAQEENQANIDKLIGYLYGEETAFDNVTSSIEDTTKAYEDIADIYYDGSNVTGGLSEIVKKAADAAWELALVKEGLEKLSATAVSASLNGLSIAINAQQKANGGIVGYANGGIPRFDGGGINSANLFMAHENGMPELVGRIGNRTAVANTGQMVDAMAQGVYEAMSQFGGTSNIEVVVNMDGETVARAADRGNKSLNRRFNVSLA